MPAQIFFNILAPILLMILLGALLRWKFATDLGTLTKLNIYLFAPAFVFHRVSTSELPWAAMGGIVAVTIIQVSVLGLLVWGGGLLLGVNRKTLAAVALAVMFYNSGNFGLPLAELASGHEGAAVQTFVLTTLSIMTFTLGLSIAAWAGSGQIGKGLVTLFRLPILPMLLAAVLARWWLGGDPERELPIVISKSAEYLANGLIPVALITLGAQLAVNPRWPRWKPVSLVLLLRLVVAPMLMMGLLFTFSRLGWGPLNLWPTPAGVLILTAAVPSAINTVLLTLELDGDAELLADCVFWTTVASCLTITFWLVVLMPML